MQLSQSALLSVASLIALSKAEDLLVALNSDIKSNMNQYLSYVSDHSTADYLPLLTLYQEAQTYTDDSYTTLVGSDELVSISSFATELPWYSSRIAPELDDSAATTTAAHSHGGSHGSSAAASSAVASSTSAGHGHVHGSASASASASNSAASQTSSSNGHGHGSASASASAGGAAASASDSGAASTASATSTSTGGAANAYIAPGAGLALVLGAVALL